MTALHPVELSRTAYPAVRLAMGPPRLTVDDAGLEALLGEMFPGTPPAEVENFARTMQMVMKKAAPIVQKALPGIVQGAATGMAAGPLGALAGAVGGGALSLLSGGGPAAPSAPTAPPAAAGPMPTAPMPAAPPPTGAAAPNAAVAQLLALLSRPETLQALMSLLMAQQGRPTVAVGARQVPTVAFANAIAELAADAADIASVPAGEAGSAYLLDAAGEPRCDLANPRERAALLVADAMALTLAEAAEDAEEDWEEEPQDWADDLVPIDFEDPLDNYETALAGRVSDDQ